MKRLAIGVDDFKKIIKEGCYYIDKTKFIEDVLEDGSGVKLINRPRRFGKTLNMTTLKYFFDVNESLTKLFNGEDVEETITGNSDLSSLLNYEDVWELLVFSGYLTIKEKIDRRNYILKIPNQEIREFFKDEFIDLYFRESKLKKILSALKENNIEEFERIFQNMLLSSISTWDTSKEAFYHGLSFGMLSYLDGEYYVTSNFESGYGRYDIIAEPRNKNKRGFIIECKIVKDEKDLEKMSKEAIEQIKNKKYDTQLKERGIKEITLLGLAFYGKRMKVSFE